MSAVQLPASSPLPPVCVGRGRVRQLVGLRFGRLVAVELLPIKGRSHSAMWLCRCDCGNELVVAAKRLTGGETRSCGCYRAEVARARGRAEHAGRERRLDGRWAS